MRPPMRYVWLFVLDTLVLVDSPAHAEERYEIHITDGTIFPNGFSCKEKDIEQRVYRFVGKTPRVRVAGATIQLAAKNGGEFYDPVFVWREDLTASQIKELEHLRQRRVAPTEGPWLAWFRGDQPNMSVLVQLDPTKPVPHVSIAIVDHNGQRHCGERWTGTAKRQKAVPASRKLSRSERGD